MMTPSRNKRQWLRKFLEIGETTIGQKVFRNKRKGVVSPISRHCLTCSKKVSRNRTNKVEIGQTKFLLFLDSLNLSKSV